MTGAPAARLYLWSNALFRGIHGGLQALFEGVWMGILSTRAVDAISQLSYGEGSEYTKGRHLDSGFHFWEEIAVHRFFPPECRVLVAAAGGGRELVALARAGFHADGFECSRPMVEAGQQALRERKIAGRLEWSPPCTVPDGNEMYDALIAGWNGYTYIMPRQRRVEFLKALRSRVRPGGHLLVSGAFRSARTRAEVWPSRIANALRRCTFRPPVFETGDRFPGRPRHSFTRQQIRDELAEAGFAAIEFWIWGQFGAVAAVSGWPTATPSPLSV
jgi:SAM-dependent methyltransferase